MQVKKTLLAAGAAATVGLTGVTGLGVASAASNTSTDNGSTSSIIERLAERFDLNKNEVAEVFDEERSEHEAEMKQKLEDRLDEAVADGDLTEAQKDAILTKMEELKTQREAERDELEDMTDDERHAHFKEQREALQAWADEHDIPEEYLPGLFVLKHGKGDIMRMEMPGPGVDASIE